MTAWDELKVVLAGLIESRPGALMLSPSLKGDADRTPPFTIWLAPWAADAAAELHRQFGDDVELTVGALPYPPGREDRRRHAPGEVPDLLDPREVTVALDGPAVVSSGQTLA